MLADDVTQEESAPSQVLAPLDLPVAPQVLRGVAAPVRRRKVPAVVLVVVGVVLVLGPIVGGLFAKVAAGDQLIDDFAPHMEADALARYDTDLAILRRGAAGIDQTYAEQGVAAGRFVGIDEYRAKFTAIDGRATDLLDRIGGAEPDYRRVSDIGGFDRVPFLIVAAGIVAVWGGCVLLAGTRGRARAAAGAVVLAAAALIAYPLLGDLPNGTRAGERMLNTLEPVMTAGQVRLLQDDFVATVHAVGELDTGFRSVPQAGVAAADIATLVDQWPAVSSDLAELVGTLHDNLDDYDDLADLDGLTNGVGVSGLRALPWVLVGIGLLCAACSLAATPRRRKEIA